MWLQILALVPETPMVVAETREDTDSRAHEPATTNFSPASVAVEGRLHPGRDHDRDDGYRHSALGCSGGYPEY